MTVSRTLIRTAALLLISTFLAGAAMAFPTARTALKMTYDEHLQRVVLFGGVTDPDSSATRYYLNDTWEWTGQRWIQIFTENAPSPRSGVGMTYESSRQQVLLFGGVNAGTEYQGDTWAYRNRDWVRIQTPNAPSPRMFAAMTFDPLRDRTILFGGTDASGSLRDTWEFDGTTWTRVGENGPTLLTPNIVYDPARNETLLLGLNDSADNTEMYRWTDNGWDRIIRETLPPCINLGSMVYQSHNQKVLAVGGQCANGSLEDETWEWDGANWFEVDVTASQGSVVAFGLAYDSARSNAVLFGGDSFGTSSTTYLLIGGSWRPLFDTASPGPRSLMVFEYDPTRNVYWMFGGRTAGGEASDLWMLSGTIWTQVRAANTPTACLTPAGDWDTSRNRLVIFCNDASIHEWDGETWNNPTTTGEKPSLRRWSAMAFDPTRQESILFGGYDFNNSYLRDTWSWNGTRWTRLGKDKTAPPARALTSMFYDPRTRRVTLFGGIGRNNQEDTIRRYGDMWSFDGTSWAQIGSNVTLPGPRYGAQAVLNPTTQNVMLFGGKSDSEQYLNDQWEWNGTAWRKIELIEAPRDRMNYGLLFDQQLQRYVLYGGYAGQYYAEIWILNGDTWVPQQAPFAGRRRPVTVAAPGVSGSLAPARVGSE